MAQRRFRTRRQGVHGGSLAVSDCTLHVEDGELMVVVGPSGCGKSTLLRLLAGLESVTRGTLRIGGRVVNDLTPQERNVAMVFQDYALYPHTSVRGNLEFPLRMRRLATDEMRRRVEWAAGLLGLEAVARSAAARALRRRSASGSPWDARSCASPPSSSSTSRSRTSTPSYASEMRAEIGELQRRTATTMLYVTHDQVEAMTLGDRVTVLDRGRVQQISAPRELYERPANVFVAGFIGNPPMNLFPMRVSIDGGSPRVELDGQALRVARRARLFAGPSRRPAADGRRPTGGAAPRAIPANRRSTPSSSTPKRSATRRSPPCGRPTPTRRKACDWIVRLPSAAELAKGQAVEIAFDRRALHLFDENGQALAGASAR